MKQRVFIMIVLVFLDNSLACEPSFAARRFAGAVAAAGVGAAFAIHQYFSSEIKTELWNCLKWLVTRCYTFNAGLKVSPVKSFPEIPQHALITRSKELQEIGDLFTGCSSHCKVPFVYLSGLPGSGKSELARQYGEHGFQRGKYTTVIALNAETEEQFRRDMANAVLVVELQSDTKRSNTEKTVKSSTFQESPPYLSNRLRVLLLERPSWLILVDNIRTVQLALKLLKYVPKAGSDNWSKGHVLVTTQVEEIVPPHPGECVMLKKINEGLTSQDATSLLCKLVNASEKQCQNNAERVAAKLEYLPLAILAAGVFIREEMKTNVTYSLTDYIEKFEINMKSSSIYYEHFGSSGAYPYKYSMNTALNMAVNQSIHSRSDKYQRMIRDVYFFIGFIDQQEVPYDLLSWFLQRKGYDKAHILSLTHSSFIDFHKTQKTFKIHQVTRKSFQEVMKNQIKMAKSATVASESLLIKQFQEVSDFLFTEYEKRYDTTLYFCARSFFECVYRSSGYVLPDITSDSTLETSGSLFTILFYVKGFTPDKKQNCTYTGLDCKYIQTFLKKLCASQARSAKPILSVYFQANFLLRTVYRDLGDKEQARQCEERSIKLVKQALLELSSAEAESLFSSFADMRFRYKVKEGQSADTNERRKYYAQLIRFMDVLFHNTYLDFGTWVVVGNRYLEEEMLEDAKQHFQKLLEKLSSSSITKIFPYMPATVLFKLGHVHNILGDYQSAEAAFTEGFSSGMPLDVKEPSADKYMGLLSDSRIGSARVEFSSAKLQLSKLDDAVNVLKMGMFCQEKVNDGDYTDILSLQVITQLLKILQKHKSNSSITFATYGTSKELLLRCTSVLAASVQSVVQSTWHTHPDRTPQHMEQFVEAVKLSINICNKQVASELLEMASKLEKKKRDVISDHFQTVLKELTEKTRSLQCSVWGDILHFLSSYLSVVTDFFGN